jgi:hypothetical protein
MDASKANQTEPTATGNRGNDDDAEKYYLDQLGMGVLAAAAQVKHGEQLPCLPSADLHTAARLPMSYKPASTGQNSTKAVNSI